MLRAYLELLRPPNIATALADVLAGFAVAGLLHPARLPWLLAATMCLYGGGIVLNDFFDRTVDAVERPERPIPSGRVSARHAASLGAILLTAGVVSAAQASRASAIVAVVTAAAILLYDSWGKRQTYVGPLNMGACRGLNLALGMSAAPAALAVSWWLGFIPLLYISAVTAVSRGEVHGGKSGAGRFALISLAVVLIALALVALRPGQWSAVGLGLLLVLAVRVLPPFWNAYRTPRPETVRGAVRTGVLSLVLLDAVIGAAYGGALYAATILATALGAGWLARRFAVT
jgi:4-hydroxybenzoate polyprenyltransferase